MLKLSEKLPESLNILGIPYRVKYMDVASEVDPGGKSVMWGYIDYWGRNIHVYKGEKPIEDILHTLFHEVFHAICEQSHIDLQEDENEKITDVLSLGFTDFLIRNEFIDIEQRKDENL